MRSKLQLLASVILSSACFVCASQDPLGPPGPTPACTTIYPSDMKVISEVLPTRVASNDLTNFFTMQVETNPIGDDPATLADRSYTVAGFQIPEAVNPEECVLWAEFAGNWSQYFNTNLPDGPPVILARQLLGEREGGDYLDPIDWSWDIIVGGGLENGPTLGSFKLVPGTFSEMGRLGVDGVSSSHSIAFVYSILRPSDQGALATGVFGPDSGVFLVYGCLL